MYQSTLTNFVKTKKPIMVETKIGSFVKTTVDKYSVVPDPIDIDKPVEISTDGSAFDNGKRHAKGGIGVYFGESDPRNVSRPFKIYPVTNQRAELYAMITALKIEKSHRIIIHTDNEYSINCATKWIKVWQKNGWLDRFGRPVKNQDLVKELWDLCRGRLVTFNHVRAHTERTDRHSIGNREADRLARAGTNMNKTT